MKTPLRMLSGVLLVAALLIPTTGTATAATQECSPTAFRLDDVQGVYDAVNIEVVIYPCGGVFVRTGRDGTLLWGGVYTPRERLENGTITMYIMDTAADSGSQALVYNNVQYNALAMTPDVPGVMRLWSVTPNGDRFETFLDKMSDTPTVF